MACHYMLIALCLFSCVPFLGLAQPFKGVNLGNWLVIVGWMEPSLFDGLPNNNLLDGTQVTFMSNKLQKYLTAENGGGGNIAANKPSPSNWETFRLWRINETYFNLRLFNKNFVGLSAQGSTIVAVSGTAGNSETFQIIRNANNPNLVLLKAANDKLLQVQSETAVTADYAGTGTGWNLSDPSFFRMNSTKTLRGEYQLTNGYGPEKARQVLQNHWNTYITEDDFNFLSRNGINAVRIPVGWWIASDPSPPKPFVGGSLLALDNAFTWARKHNIKVIVDLHAIKAAQNDDAHSGTRDGYLDTVAVIEFLAARYGKNQSLAAIELMNEPTAPGVTLDALKKYCKAGYDAVRKYSNAYVVLSNRLGPASRTGLPSFASTLNRVVIDVHHYNLYEEMFEKMNAQQNIDFIYNNRSKRLSEVSNTNAVLSFVGEWPGEWALKGASMEEYKKFAEAQLQVYGNATFGWAYWSYKCVAQKLSLKWMIENNYIKIA